MAAFGFGESHGTASDTGDTLLGQSCVHQMRALHGVEEAVGGSEVGVIWRFDPVQLHLTDVRMMDAPESATMQSCLVAHCGAEMVDHHCFCTAAEKRTVRNR